MASSERLALRIHQALHGYREGHQLLAISGEWSSDQLAQLRVMSDLSGPAFRSGFDSYVTGYPLHGAQWYALARTWCAREMPRPGCVWTHTLLIATTDLVFLPDVVPLGTLFRRPEDSDNVSGYTGVLEFLPHSLIEQMPLLWQHDVAVDVIDALYGASRAAVVLVAVDSATHEELTLRVWSQQWPALRQHFRFCTGSLSLKGEPMDLVVAPPEAARQVRDVDDVVLIEERRARADVDIEVAAVVADLLGSVGGGSLRHFLWRFGPDCEPTRDSLRALTDLFVTSEHLSEGPEVIGHALTVFSTLRPSAMNLDRIAEWMFGATRVVTDPSATSNMAHTLITHPAARYVSEEIGACDRLAKLIVVADVEEALTIGSEAADFATAHSHLFLRGLAEWYQTQSTGLAGVSVKVATELVRRAPDLALVVQTWERPPDQQRALANALDDSWAASRVATLVAQLSKIGAWTALDVVTRRFGRVAVGGVLDACETSSWVPTIELVQAFGGLASEVSAALQARSIGPRGLWLAAAILDPRQFAGSVSASVFHGVIGSSVDGWPAQVRARACGFLFALARSSSDRRSVSLFMPAFIPIYRAAEANRLDAEAWSRVEPFLPWTYPDWDRCKRLIRAVLDKILDHWALPEFFNIFREPDVFRRATTLVGDDYWSGARFLRNARRAVKQAEAMATDDQASILGDDGRFT